MTSFLVSFLMVIIIRMLYFIDGDITQIVTSFSWLYLSERAGVNIILYNIQGDGGCSNDSCKCRRIRFCWAKMEWGLITILRPLVLYLNCTNNLFKGKHVNESHQIDGNHYPFNNT